MASRGKTQTNTRITAFFQYNLDKHAGAKRVKNNLDFNEARDDGVAVASAGPYAYHLHLAPDSTSSLRFLTGRMLFLTPNGQNAEGYSISLNI